MRDGATPKCPSVQLLAPERSDDGCLPRNTYDHTRPSDPLLTRVRVSNSIHDYTAQLLHDLSHTQLADLWYEPMAQSAIEHSDTRTDKRPSGHQVCLEQSVPWSATSIVTRNRVLAACLSLLICTDWAFVSWRASQEFPGTSRESQRLVMSLLSLQRDFPGSRTGRRRREAGGAGL